MSAPVVVSDPQTREMLTRYRALPRAAKPAFIAMMAACAAGEAIYPAALRFMQAMGHPDAETMARQFADDMQARKVEAPA